MTRRFRSARDAERHLLSFVNYETRTRYRQNTRTHNLRRFRAQLIEAGWDPAAVPTVHVAGTNAKGSVCWLLERVLRAGGLRTGLYTSPHLQSMRERVRINGKPLGAELFRDGVERIDAVFGAKPGAGFRTTFEHLTALAFLAFQEAHVDRAVVEVGLGGRLDSTNVLAPGPVILTPISLDHLRVLGRTVGAIAADKAHVIKRGGAAFVMPQSPTARKAIESRCGQVRVRPAWTRDTVTVRTVSVSLMGSEIHVMGDEDYGVIRTGLLGEHAEQNVTAVVSVAQSLLPRTRLRSAVRRGLRAVQVPGRLETHLVGTTTVVLDGGHNAAAGRAVARAVVRHAPGARITAVIGMARDKRHRAFLKPLAPILDRVVLCRAGNPRAATEGQLGRALDGLVGRVVEGGSVLAALEAALSDSPDLVLMLGSFIVVGEARRAMGLRTP